MIRLRSFAVSACRFGLTLLIASSGLQSTARADLGAGQVQYDPVLNPSYSFFTPSYVAGPIPSAYNILKASTKFDYNYNGQKDGSFFGSVTSSVYANSTGQLAFSYVFDNLQPPPSLLNNFDPNPPLTDIVRATINDPSNPWAGFSTLTRILSAGSDSSGHSTAINGFFGGWSNGDPFSIQRDGTNDSIAINFNPLNSGTQLNSTPNDQSAVIWLTTDATRFDYTNVGLSDNGHVGTAQAYAPKVNGTFPTPEPSSLVLAAMAGLGGVLLIRRKRRTSASA
jgi:PEP-CTERM motif